MPVWFSEINRGLSWVAKRTRTYTVNKYKFQTESYCEGKNKQNYGVCVPSDEGKDYYGVLEDIIHYEFLYSNVSVVLFKCRWYDPHYVVIYPENGLTELNCRRKYDSANDPYVLAHQATQVYYTKFPGKTSHARRDMLAVCKVRPTGTIDNVKIADTPFQHAPEPNDPLPLVDDSLLDASLVDLRGDVMENLGIDEVVEDEDNVTEEEEEE